MQFRLGCNYVFLADEPFVDCDDADDLLIGGLSVDVVFRVFGKDKKEILFDSHMDQSLLHELKTFVQPHVLLQCFCYGLGHVFDLNYDMIKQSPYGCVLFDVRHYRKEVLFSDGTFSHSELISRHAFDRLRSQQRFDILLNQPAQINNHFVEQIAS